METSDVLVAELVYLGRRVHWPLAELIDLDHPTRRRLLAEVERTDERG